MTVIFPEVGVALVVKDVPLTLTPELARKQKLDELIVMLPLVAAVPGLAVRATPPTVTVPVPEDVVNVPVPLAKVAAEAVKVSEFAPLVIVKVWPAVGLVVIVAEVVLATVGGLDGKEVPLITTAELPVALLPLTVPTAPEPFRSTLQSFLIGCPMLVGRLAGEPIGAGEGVGLANAIPKREVKSPGAVEAATRDAKSCGASDTAGATGRTGVPRFNSCNW